MKNSVFCIFALICSSFAHAVDLDCYEDPRTNATQCIDAAGVRITKDGIRYSKLYTGGPAEVKDSRFTIHANCNTSVIHLKDRQGVSFAGGVSSKTRALTALHQKICSANIKK